MFLVVKTFSKKEMREAFDRYAEAEGFDPVLPENWVNFNSTLFSKVAIFALSYAFFY